MDPDCYEPPPPYEEVVQGPSQDPAEEPAALILADQSIHAKGSSTPLYQLSQSVTCIPQKHSSVRFERVEETPTFKGRPFPPQTQHLFYVAHPENARYRKDIPDYYITSVSAEISMGNMRLETSKSPLQKTEFAGMLSPKKTAYHKPLFDESIEQTLFTAKPKWSGGRYKYRWTDAGGKQVAIEDGPEEQFRLVVTGRLERQRRDALVALWVLRVWHETAESRQAKREVLNSWTVPDEYPDVNVGCCVG